jgi:molybdopterin-guanine dinucleotide biosynthesis protein A
MPPETGLALPPLTIAVLAGGRSARFGSDKALALLDGRTLLDIALRHFTGTGAELLVAVDRADRYAVPAGVRAVTDRFPGCGPLAAVDAALEEAAYPIVCCSSVDAPRLSPTLLVPLVRAIESGAQAAIYARNGFRLPFPCALDRDACRRPVRELLAAHVASRPANDDARAPRLLALFDAVRQTLVEAPAVAAGSPDPLADVDTPEDLQRLLSS